MFGKALIAVGTLISLAALIGWGSEPLEEAHLDSRATRDGRRPRGDRGTRSSHHDEHESTGIENRKLANVGVSQLRVLVLRCSHHQLSALFES